MKGKSIGCGVGCVNDSVVVGADGGWERERLNGAKIASAKIRESSLGVVRQVDSVFIP